jgi:hypothetical protein
MNCTTAQQLQGWSLAADALHFHNTFPMRGRRPLDHAEYRLTSLPLHMIQFEPFTFSPERVSFAIHLVQTVESALFTRTYLLVAGTNLCRLATAQQSSFHGTCESQVCWLLEHFVQSI